jgi:hypothetical protein
VCSNRHYNKIKKNNIPYCWNKIQQKNSRGKIDTLYKQIQNHSIIWLCTDTSIKGALALARAHVTFLFYNSQHNNNNNVVLAMTMPYSGIVIANTTLLYN